MKVFVFCIALVLASTVNSSPIESEETAVQNVDIAIEAEPEHEVEPIQKFEVPEETIEVEEPAVDEEAVNLINEPSEEVAVPYQEEEHSEDEVEVSEVEVEESEPFIDESMDEEESVEMTEEEKERSYGIDIPMCEQHTDYRNPLHLSHMSDCHKFYKCYNGRGYLMDCPSDEHWSVNLNRCDYPPIAKCRPTGTLQFKIKKAKAVVASSGDQENDDQPEVGEFEIDPRCEGSDPFKPLHFRHISDCTKFYKCYMGKAYVIKCPKGQQWGQHLNRCEHPSLARCTIVKPVIKPAQVIEEIEDEDEEDDGPHYDEDFIIRDPRCEQLETDLFHPIQFAHPSDCGAFYMCALGKAYKYRCPAGLHYNSEKQACDFALLAKCAASAYAAHHVVEAVEVSEEESAEFQASQTQEQVYDITKDEDYMIFDSRCNPNDDDLTHPVQFAHPRDCHFFYKCFRHIAYKHVCAADLLYDEAKERCDYRQRVRCQAIAPASFVQASEVHPMPQDFMNNLPEFMMQHPEFMNQFAGYMNQYPGMMGFPQYQGNFPQIPMVPQYPMQQPQAPQPQAPQVPQPQAPQIPQPLAPQNPDFPSWMPQPRPNIPLPEFPSGPITNTDSKDPQFNYQDGKENSRCPTVDQPNRPTHLGHETQCAKFYKCFNGRAFLMSCPEAQEWSDELQRCDYHEFANCDATELLKKKIQH